MGLRPGLYFKGLGRIRIRYDHQADRTSSCPWWPWLWYGGLVMLQEAFWPSSKLSGFPRDMSDLELYWHVHVLRGLQKVSSWKNGRTTSQLLGEFRWCRTLSRNRAGSQVCWLSRKCQTYTISIVPQVVLLSSQSDLPSPQQKACTCWTSDNWCNPGQYSCMHWPGQWWLTTLSTNEDFLEALVDWLVGAIASRLEELSGLASDIGQFSLDTNFSWWFWQCELLSLWKWQRGPKCDLDFDDVLNTFVEGGVAR